MKEIYAMQKNSTTSTTTFSRALTLVLGLAMVATLSLASCTKAKKADGEGGAESSGMSDAGPQVTDKDMAYDQSGSDGGNISGLSTIFFEYDQARLTDSSKNKLKENADWIRANPAVTVQIEGHTDSRGSTEYNLSLGERRAKSVRQYLEGLGVESKRMTILSYGEEKPLAQGDTEAAFSKNRRANFVPVQ
jgi:peptidoglycan-associated lipoprotein